MCPIFPASGRGALSLRNLVVTRPSQSVRERETLMEKNPCVRRGGGWVVAVLCLFAAVVVPFGAAGPTQFIVRGEETPSLSGGRGKLPQLVAGLAPHRISED